jgi:hypothetical protein
MVLLAEQIAIDCPPRTLEDLFRHRPVDWITPLLRLAGDEGEAAGLAVLGERAESPGARQHRVELGQGTCDGGAFRAGLFWRTEDYRALFAEFEGTIEVRSLAGRSVLGIEGLCTGPATATTAGRRAAEYAVRSLLGHLRAAVEASPLSAR